MRIFILIAILSVTISFSTADKIKVGKFNEVENFIHRSRSELHQSLLRLNVGLNALRNYLDDYNVNGHQHNGLRSVCRVVDKYFIKVYEILQTHKSAASLKDLNNSAQLLEQLLSIARTIIVGPKDEYDVTRQILSVDQTMMKSMMEMDTFWLEPSMKLPWKMYRAIYCLTLHPTHLELFNKTHVLDTAAKFSYEGDIQDLITLRHFWETQATNTSDEVQMRLMESPNQFDFVIDQNGKISRGNISRTKRNIESLIISDGPPNGDIIFHTHGGGFLEMRPQGHSIYLQNWAQQMPGITIVSVNFRLGPEHKYPASLQDILDVYLWLTNHKTQHEVSQSIGFIPRKIVVFGDSGGGNLGLSLLNVLHRIDWPRKPDGIFLLYPLITPTLKNITKFSHALMTIDPILSTSAFFSWTDAYAPGETMKRDSPWYRSKDLETRLDEIDLKAQSDELFNPILNGFEALGIIPIVTIVGESDPLLDESIELIRHWPNDLIELHVIKGQTHAFPLMADKSQAAKRDTNYCVQKLIELFDRIS